MRIPHVPALTTGLLVVALVGAGHRTAAFDLDADRDAFTPSAY